MITPADRFFVLDYETTGIEAADVPIEVGVVVTDTAWRGLEAYDSLIYSLAALHRPWEDAERVHGISRDDCRDGRHFRDVAYELVQLAERHRQPGGRMILLSDNIQFEWRHTDWLLSSVGRRVTDVFHYCGWDTSILGLFTPFRDPRGAAHRALADARGLVEALRDVAAGGTWQLHEARR